MTEIGGWIAARLPADRDLDRPALARLAVAIGQEESLWRTHVRHDESERFYQQLVPQTLEICKHAEGEGKADAAWKVRKKLDDILKRPEHQWFPRPKLPPEPTGKGS